MDIAAAYAAAWNFSPPRSCRAMHAQGLFAASGPAVLRFGTFEVHSPAMIAEGDAFVTQQLVPGLIPIGGDRTGDRWCFDTRRRIGRRADPGGGGPGTIPVAYCPHDGGGAQYVAPSFAAFVYRLIVENLALLHLFEGWGEERAGVSALTLANVDRAERWLLRRWAEHARAAVRAPWPTYEAFDGYIRRDPAFRRLPEGEFPHFR
jgi:hypothetical protein